MATKAARRVNKPFDPAKFDALNEPLEVRVEKEKGGSRTKIPLPRGEDGSEPGTNLSKEAVRGLEELLVNKWSGGGFYIFTVTDSSQPTRQIMEWDIWYNPVDYPEKNPPSLAEAAGMTIVPFAPQPQPQVSDMAPPPTAFPNLPGAGFLQPPTQRPVVADDRYAAGYAAAIAAWQQQQMYGQAQAQPDADRRRLEDELRRKDDEIRKRDLDAAQAKYAADLERERRERDTVVQRLEQQLRELAQNAAKPQGSSEIDTLKAELERERRERDADRREREMKEQMARQAEDSRRQFDELRRQFEATQQQLKDQVAAASKDNRPDPIIGFLQESMRQITESMKEQSRNATLQLEKLQGLMMHPRDVMALAKESSNGVDQVTSRISAMYTSILEMQQTAVKQMFEMSSQGSGDQKIALVEKGIERASSWAERYFAGKSKESVVEQQSKAEIAKANASMMQAQAEAMKVQAAMQMRAAQGTPPTPRPAQPGPAPAQATPVPTAATVEPPPQPTAVVADPSAPPNTPRPVKRLGRTDEQWFGPALPKMVELRVGVDRMLESIQMQPPRVLPTGHVDGVEPLQAAIAILKAADFIVTNKVPVPAVTDLLQEGRVADLLDVILPNAPQGYKDEVVQLMIAAMNGQDIEAPAELPELPELPDSTNPEDPNGTQDGGSPPTAAPPGGNIVLPQLTVARA